ncbi:glycosyltransferase family 4 protein [Baekduia soli]|uniref:Glycosyltransferase family 4 protein n=1 Tax=Baekduia soli TaxID=496014 RepID=A0A5B8TZS0_9ACTN|nr:glycosyltransferase [Baekduia soli]QEC46227.1 glycosyltransferase family 4 protein [Baekduia soli]
MRVAFVLQDLQLSGGVGVAVEHAAQLRRHHGIDARLVLARPQEHPHWGYRGLDQVPVLGLAEALELDWDIAVATWWETTSVLFRLRARRHAYFIQLLEDSAYPAGAPERLAAAMTTALPVRFITEARWLAELLEDYQPGTRVLYVRNGIPKDVFAIPDRVAPATGGEPLRVVLEGARGYVQKGVDDALAAVAAMREPAHVTWVSPHPTEPPPGVDTVLSGLSHAEMAQLFGEQHVILKLSRAEGMYGPPLEAFHRGATVVTTPVTGHDEYIEHGVNGLVVGWDDIHGTARTLDLLARDRRLLHELRTGALRTARAWPDWRQSSQWMALALRRVLAEPMPPVRGAGMRLVSDFASVTAEGQAAARRLEIEQAIQANLFSQKAWIYAVRARRELDRLRQLGRRVGRPVKRLLRR